MSMVVLVPNMYHVGAECVGFLFVIVLYALIIFQIVLILFCFVVVFNGDVLDKNPLDVICVIFKIDFLCLQGLIFFCDISLS